MTEGRSETIENQRRAPRHRALLAAKLSHSQGDFTLPCTIRDISELGARVRLPVGQSVPKDVYLIDIRARCAFDARMVWHCQPDIGLEFREKILLDENCQAKFRHLRRILIDALPQ